MCSTVAQDNAVVISDLGVGVDFAGFLGVVIDIELCACWYVASREKGQPVYFLVRSIKYDCEHATVWVARVVHKACWSSKVQAVHIVDVFCVEPVQAENV